METTAPYQIPTALTVLAGTFLALGAICLIIPIVDIVWRRGLEVDDVDHVCFSHPSAPFTRSVR